MIIRICSKFLLCFVLILNVFNLETAQAIQNKPSPLSFYPVYAEPPLYYLRQADLNIAPARQDLRLKAVISYIQDNNLNDAKALIEALHAEPITLTQLSQAKLLSARIALMEDQPQKALDVLYTLPPYLAYYLMVAQHDLLAIAYAELNEHILSIEQRVSLNVRLKDKKAQAFNNDLIWKSIENIPKNQILAIHNATSNPALKAWLSVANMKQQYVNDPVSLERAISQWQQEYPDHPGLSVAQLHVVAKQKLANIEKSPPYHSESADNADSAYGQQALILNNQDEEYQVAMEQADGLVPIQQYQPTTIAVLLPKQGAFAPAAKAIEQGIMNAYYQEPEETRPIVQFYDSSENVRAVYQRAVQQGAKFIIGPLSKNNTNELYRGKHFPVKTLVLNDLPYQLSPSTQHSFFQFSLSNEDEAYQAAQRAYQDGRANALVIRSDKDWGYKIQDAFSANFIQYGGSIRETVSLNEKDDPAPQIKKLLGFKETPEKILVNQYGEQVDPKDVLVNGNPSDIQAMMQVAQQANIDIAANLSGNQTTQTSSVANKESAENSAIESGIEQPKFKEKLIRHRTDVDMIFLALSPLQAQRVIPLLKFYYANDIPVYTTSIINNTHVDDSQDFDGTLFCDMPWIVSDNYQTGTLRNTIEKLWPNSYTTEPRLFAFGMDAYRIARELQGQNDDLLRGIKANTGTLTLVSQNKIFRQLPWAQYKNGKFEMLDAVSAR